MTHKNKNGLRIFAFVMAMMLLVSMVPVNVMAENTDEQTAPVVQEQTASDESNTDDQNGGRMFRQNKVTMPITLI